MGDYLATYKIHCGVGGMDTGFPDSKDGTWEYRFKARTKLHASTISNDYVISLERQLHGINKKVSLVRLLKIAEEIKLN